MIRAIEKVKIDGKNSAFGGFIYRVSLSVGVNGEPTRLNINFISENGEYLKPALSYTKPYKIQIGDIFDGNFFAVKFRKQKTSQGRFLEVIFEDGSSILNRIWVSLRKRTGVSEIDDPKVASLNKANKYIVLGKEIHPCDVDNNGVFDAQDILSLHYDQSDPCELRCPNDEFGNGFEPIIENCREKEITEIFDVAYTFSELITEINKFVKVQLVPQQKNQFYRNRYTGRLSDVLSSWCADFGWSFFWEDDRLNFIDTSKPVRIRFDNFSQLESSEETESIENTQSIGVISSFLEPGIFAQRECEKPQKFWLRCLTLKDLFGEVYTPDIFAIQYPLGDENRTSPGTTPEINVDDSSKFTQAEYKDDVAPKGVSIEHFETSCICSFFSQSLRNLYVFFRYYGITNSTQAESLKDKWLDRLGQMKIIKVLNSESNSFSLLTSNPFSNGQFLFDNDTEKADFIKRQGYFAFCFFNEKLLDRQFGIENRLSTEFLGQHWMRPFVFNYLGETPQIAPNGQYYGSLSTEARDLPFTVFNHEKGSYVGKLVQNLNKKQKPVYRVYNRLRKSLKGSNPSFPKLVKSIIYAHKNPVWNPVKNAISTLENLLKKKEPNLFRLFDIEDTTLFKSFLQQEIEEGTIKEEDLPKIKLLAFFPGEFAVSRSFINNENEENPHVTEDPRNIFVHDYYGLMSKRCVRYNIDGLQIDTPAGASVHFEYDGGFKWLGRMPDFNQESSKPIYRVLVTSSTKNRGIVPKIESVLVDYAKIDDKIGKVDYIAKNINRGSIKYLNNLNNSCEINPELLKEAHEQFIENLNHSNKEPQIEKVFTIIGINLPKKLKIKDGLQSLDVSIDEDKVNTTVSIGNSLFTPPALDFIERKIEFEQQYSKLNNRPNPIDYRGNSQNI